MFEKRGQLGGVGDLLEAEDRALELLEGLLVDLEPIGDRQHEPRRAVTGQEPDQPFEARPLPEADDLDEDVEAGGCVDDAVVGDPDAFAAQLDDVGALADLPGRRDLAEPLDERGELGRDVGAGVGLMRDQAVARLEVEAPRLALGPQRSSASSRKSAQCKSAGRNRAT